MIDARIGIELLEFIPHGILTRQNPAAKHPHVGMNFLATTLLQLPENLPYPVTGQGLIAGIVVFVLVTLVTRKITRSRQSWIPGLIFGLIAGFILR